MVDTKELSVEEKLRALYDLQNNDSHIDKIKILRGELPLEVRDLEDEFAGLETRMSNLNDEVTAFSDSIAAKANAITESKNMVKKYEEQQMKVRNNREYDSLTKEIEFQNLEIELSEKRIREFNSKTDEKKNTISDSNVVLKDKQDDLAHKKSELDAIIADTQKDEDSLQKKSEEIQTIIEPRLLAAYTKIRGNARNGLALVSVERDACGGCFNKIPPQRQLDIRSQKKIIVCEYCGRILVDYEISNQED